MKIITEKMMKIVEINQCAHCLVDNDTACYESSGEIGCARYEKATRKAVYSMIDAYIEKLNAWGGQHA